ncbi:hypothetical protein FPQ18DRAFT_314218 [Pyronema domesticum]|uniref:Protein transport protein SEC31 n=1 Tax=Pyronema omphalodes (strain CBS 100304) TaxID=1076935 RepID=U4L838_PYROM|nr:hypothetical protein FPQ18DRAFT_314218 [Pyronema domesticum]CCX13539.1 Similar to Protein transport protein sec31; acc. no. Q0CYG9 [Pyronema omphalodes CBS 100304]
MAKLRDIQRTAAFAWSPNSDPLIATGTQAGAVSADFSDNTQLELWDLDLGGDSQAELSPVASVETDSKFNDIAWGRQSNDKPRGIIAGGMENGSLDLWSADALLDKSSNPLISQTTRHTGAIKALQFNPFKPELLATAGVGGELYLWDLNDSTNTPHMFGNKAARADDLNCLDWNKKVSNILITGGSGGFVTVWDLRTKKDSITINNLNRKAVSAVAWHPLVDTQLLTATSDDTNPVVLMWDLKNANAPLRTLSGHTAGVLSLSWCKQDSDLLLSSGKDNRTICWNPESGEMLGEFPIVTNWTFKTSFNPRNPSYIATASYDGKIAVHTLQNTNPNVDGAANTASGDDFFSRASNAQTSSFSLKQTPKWLQRPAGATFGFGGKLVSFKSDPATKKSTVKITTVAVDPKVNEATERFEKAIKEGNLVSMCDEKAQDAKSEEEKSEWAVLKALFEQDTKSKLVEHLGFRPEDISTPTPEKEDDAEAPAEETGDSGDFLASLSVGSSQSARINDPFQIYNGDDTEADKAITKAVVLGEYERAVDVCLKEDRISDAFMLAICGGDKCIDKVKAAYFKKKTNGPSYLRLLASVVGGNMWDVVHNADVQNWKEVVVALCKHGEEREFQDLIEALGDRLEEEFQSKKDTELRQAALSCYLIGSKLQKVVNIWITDLQNTEKADTQEQSEDSAFSVHVKSLQNFIEKVTVFREAVKFVDDEKNLSAGWKLSSLYEKYKEYADVVAEHGQIEVAGKYLALLPVEYPAAEAARDRVKQATRSAPAAVAPTSTGRYPAPVVQPAAVPSVSGMGGMGYAAQAPRPAPVSAYPGSNHYVPTQPTQPIANPYAPTQPTQPIANPYAPTQPIQSRYPVPASQAPTGQFTAMSSMRTSSIPPPPPPKQTTGTANWNDTPDVVRPARRATPAAPQQASTSPFSGSNPYGPPQASQPPPPPGRFGTPPVPSSLPPPPGRFGTPPVPATLPPPPGRFGTPPQPNQAPAPSPYGAPPQAAQPPPPGRYAPPPQAAQPPAGPYGAPVQAAQPPPPPGRYAPPPQAGQPPAGPYGAPPQAAQPPPPAGLYGAPPQATQPPPPGRYGPPPQAAQPPPAAYGAPPQASRPPPPSNYAPPPAQPGFPPQAVASPPQQPTPTPPPSKHPKGDRSHIPAQYMPIYELLSADMERVKSKAPAALARQVSDTEKRLGILFDHINNEELLTPSTLEDMLILARAVAARDFNTAQSIQVNLTTNKTTECAQWMTGVKRLIDMSKVAE